MWPSTALITLSEEGKEPGLTKELPSIGLVLYKWVLFVTKASSLMINTAFIQGAVLLLHTPLNPLT